MPSMTPKSFFNLILIISFLLITAIIPYFVFEYIKDNIRKDILDAMQTVNKTTAQTLDLWVEEEKSIVKSWAEQSDTLTKYVQQLLKLEANRKELELSGAAKKIRTHLMPVIKNKGYEDFYIISPELINIASMWPEYLGKPSFLTQGTNVLERAFEGETILTPPQELGVPLSQGDGSTRRSTVPAMFIISPIKNQQGDILSLLAFRINPSDHFTHLLQLGRIGKTGETYAINQDALLISDSRYERELRQLGFIEKGQSGILKFSMHNPGYNLLKNKKMFSLAEFEKAPLTLMAKSVIAGIDGYDLDGYRDYLGVPVIGVWHKNAQLGIGIATEITVDDAFSTLNTIWLAITISAAINILLIMALIIKFVQHNRAIERQSLSDGLTGLANRRMLDIKLDLEFASCMRNCQPLSVCMIDIDYFKVFNDKLGHLAGDEALKTVAGGIESTIKRKSDLVARYGGEEFCVVLGNTPLAEATLVAERIRESIAALKIPHHKSHSHPYVSISIGVACLMDEDESAESMLARADKGLYEAKKAGRNCVKAVQES